MAFPTFTITVNWDGDGDHTDANSDISADLASLRFIRGASFAGVPSENIGSCSVVVNNIAGKYTPDNAAGVLFGNLKPGRKLWVRSTYSAVTYALFYGTIRRIIPDPDSKTAELYCEDPLYDLSRTETSVPLSVARSIKTFRGLILDDASIVSGQRTLADGIESNMPTTLADQANALSVLESLNEGTGTLHFIKPVVTAGTWFKYTTIDRTALQSAAVAEAWTEANVTSFGGFDVTDEAIVNSQRAIPTMRVRDNDASSLWTWGTTFFLPTGTTDIRYIRLSSQADGVTVSYTATGTASATVIGYGDTAELTMVGGGSGGSLADLVVSGYAYRPLDSQGVVHTDATSSAAPPTGYGLRAGSPISSDWLESIAAAQGLATYIVQRLKDGPPRPNVTRTNDFPSVITRDVGELITWTYPLLSLVSKRYFIRAIDTTIIAGSGIWDTTYTLEQAQAAGSWFTVGGSAAEGVGGTGILAY